MHVMHAHPVQTNQSLTITHTHYSHCRGLGGASSRHATDGAVQPRECTPSLFLMVISVLYIVHQPAVEQRVAPAADDAVVERRLDVERRLAPQLWCAPCTYRDTAMFASCSAASPSCAAARGTSHSWQRSAAIPCAILQRNTAYVTCTELGKRYPNYSPPNGQCTTHCLLSAQYPTAPRSAQASKSRPPPSSVHARPCRCAHATPAAS